MIKKEFARCVMVYRNVFSEEKIKEYLNIIKDSETKNTLYINPSKEEAKNNGVIWEDSYTADGKIMSTLGWMDWYDIGKKTNIIDPDIEPYLSDKSAEKEFVKDTRKIFINIFIDYLNDHKDCQTFAPYIDNFDLTSKSWKNFPPNILKQNASSGEKKPALGYHVDAMPNSVTTLACQKRTLAANLYLNDNYDDGRISFLYGNSINNVKNFENLKIDFYKPKAGDIVVYPAGLPIAHAVERPIGSDRYVLNSFMEWEYDGSMGEELLKYIDPDVYETANIMAASVSEENIKHIDGKDFFE